MPPGIVAVLPNTPAPAAVPSVSASAAAGQQELCQRCPVVLDRAPGTDSGDEPGGRQRGGVGGGGGVADADATGETGSAG
ncbi:hypothetical protein GCM10018987_10660 [Streptomyces cremeus]